MSSTEHFAFRTALNSSTLAPFRLDVAQQISVAAEAGYEGIELWVRDVEAYLSAGGSTAELRQHATNEGISVVNGIAFFRWADADEAVRAEAIVQAQREMRMLGDLGCLAVAAPPCGDVSEVSPDEMALYFRRLSEVAREIGVEPYLEFWGRAKRLSRASEAIYIAMESGVPDARVLLDLFHMYTGGSSVDSLHLVNGAAIGMVHANDYPAHLCRDTITDKERVFPGDGVGPTKELARVLRDISYSGYVSLELFIQDYGSRTALEVASEGLEKLRRAFSV